MPLVDPEERAPAFVVRTTGAGLFNLELRSAFGNALDRVESSSG